MVMLTRTFGDKALADKTLLSVSESARQSVDIGDRGLFQQSPTSTVSTSPFSSLLPTDDPPVSLAERVDNVFSSSGVTNSRSIAQIVMPNKSFAAPAISTAGMQRKSENAATDLGSVQKGASIGAQQAKQGMAEFSKEWNKVKGAAIEQVEGAAQDQGVDSGMAVDALTPDAGASKGTAAIAVAGDITSNAMGMGSISTLGGGGSYFFQQIASEVKNLGPKEQEAVLQRTLERLQSQNNSPAQTDSRIAGGGSPGVIRSAIDSPQSGYNWKALDVEGLRELLNSDPSGQDQPEYKELADALNAELGFQKTLDNVAEVKENYGDKVTADKIEAAYENGTLEVDREVGQGAIIYAGELFTTAEPVAWAGASIQDYDGVQLDSSETVPQVADVVPSLVLVVPEPEVRLTPENSAEHQFSAAM